MKRYYFTRVKNTEHNKEGTVDEWLDKQFTVNYDDGSFGFLMYEDRGDTWEPIDEPDKETLAKLNKRRKVGDLYTNMPKGQHWATFANLSIPDPTADVAIADPEADIPEGEF